MTMCQLYVLSYNGCLFTSAAVNGRWAISFRSSTPHFHLLTLNPTSGLTFLSSDHDRNLRSSKNLLLLCLSHKSNFVNSPFFVQAVLLYNTLPLEMSMPTSWFSFKMNVYNYFLTRLQERITKQQPSTHSERM